MKYILSIFMLSLSIIAIADKPNYHYSVDLTRVSDDKLSITLLVNNMNNDTAYFSFPKMVPGTYSISDFGRFIENLKAYDVDGKVLSTSKVDVNTWAIYPAKALSKITYLMNDTYDAKEENPIFEPGGTSIESNVFMLNLFGMLGYVKGFTENPIALNITHHPMWYGSTSMTDFNASTTLDSFYFQTYHEAVDNPMMYCKPDTASVRVENTDVLISVFSKKGNRAQVLAKSLESMLKAQGKYLGGKLPVDKYSFLIYLASKNGISGGFGALEHATSSMYYIPEMPDEQLIPQLREIAAHEFFHIVTPLTIHSEEIHYFDYNKPKMSAHLWLYEGTTEYHAHAMQVKYNFYSPDDFLKNLREKMTQARFSYDDSLPFTTMSLGVLDTFEPQYPNVYAKGALIGLCLDLLLIKESDGEYDLMKLINDLSAKYGKDKPFKDEELFDVITKMTYPSVGEFLNKHVAGVESLPFEEYLAFVGVDYKRDIPKKELTTGNIDLGYDPKSKRFFIASTKNMNEFGKKMGFQEGDAILKLNGKAANIITFTKFRTKWLPNAKEGDLLRVTVLRKDEIGASKKVDLSAKMFLENSYKYNVMKFIQSPSDSQIKLKKAWLEK